MSTPTRRWRVIAPLLCCFGFAAPAGAVDLVGRKVAVFEWSAASGWVSHYHMEVNRNDGGFRSSAVAVSAETRRMGVTGEYGDAVQVRIQAVGYTGEVSEFSPASETVYFVAPTPDDVDHCPNDPAKSEPGICGCGVSERDSDADGTPDCVDSCVADSAKSEPGICGCGVSDRDSDADGTPDCLDACVADTAKTEPGICGCGVSDRDRDADGTPDCLDSCIADPAKTEPGICGCGVSDRDSDQDGTPQCVDRCIADPAKTEPGICGCGVSDRDSDADGTPDCVDSCVADSAKTEPGICGCGVSDADSDANGTADCLEELPAGEPAELLDFNADGLADLLIRKPSTGEIALLLLAYSGVNPKVPASSPAPPMKIVGNADYDGDGYADLLAHDQATGRLEIRLLENGETVETGGFQIAASQDVVGSADYDGNGYADLLLRDRTNGDLQFWSLHGTEVLEIVPLPHADAAVLGSGDYDGDGRHDILWQTGRDLFVWYLDDPANPEEETLPGIPNGYWFVGTGDYDGDGTSDVLMSNGQDFKMALFKPQGVFEYSVFENDFIPEGAQGKWNPGYYSVVGTADFDDDGFCDIALRHKDGEFMLLYMRRNFAVRRLLSALSLSWSVEGVGLENPALN